MPREIDISSALLVANTFPPRSIPNVPLVGFVGHSLLGHGFSNYLVTTGSNPKVNDTIGPEVGAKSAGYASYGIQGWLQALSFGQIDCPLYDYQTSTGSQVSWTPTYTQAVGGSRTAALSVQLQRLWAQPVWPTHVVIMSAYNDFAELAIDNASALTTLATVKANIIAPIQDVIAHGAIPILMGDTPAVWTYAYRRMAQQAYRQWQRTLSATFGAWFCETADLLADKSNSNGEPLALMYAPGDTVHWGSYGCYLVAKRLLDLFKAHGYCNLPNYGQTMQDAYDAMFNIGGNRFAYGGLNGGGTWDGNQGTNKPTGPCPAQWSNRNNNGGAGSIVSSVAVNANGNGWDWTNVITATGDIVHQCFRDITSFALGDILRGGHIDFKIAQSVNLQSINVYLEEQSSDGNTWYQRALGMGAPVGFGAMPPAFEGCFKFPGMQLGHASPKLRLMVETAVGAGGSATTIIGTHSGRTPLAA